MMQPDEILELFVDTATAVREAVQAIAAASLRDRTTRRGQYALDLVADAAACATLEQAPVRIVSEESGVHERDDAAITVVVDPVDGSTNCARGIAYWATSLCALDADGPLAALVVNQPANQHTAAVRGKGATRDSVRLRASQVTRVEDAVMGLGGLPRTYLGWKQSRALGCCSLLLCEVAAGGLDGYLDPGPYHAPWDYLGGLLACTEAGAVVHDAGGEPLVTADVAARRQLLAAGTPELLAVIDAGVR
jgi:fructose-1,6-bisphosphatase/inositol monophosphatase family enzyme